MLFESDGCRVNATSGQDHVAVYLFLVNPVGDGRYAGNNRVESLWGNVVVEVRILSYLMLGKSELKVDFWKPI